MSMHNVKVSLQDENDSALLLLTVYEGKEEEHLSKDMNHNTYHVRFHSNSDSFCNLGEFLIQLLVSSPKANYQAELDLHASYAGLKMEQQNTGITWGNRALI